MIKSYNVREKVRQRSRIQSRDEKTKSETFNWQDHDWAYEPEEDGRLAVLLPGHGRRQVVLPAPVGVALDKKAY